jgi:putative transposase
MNCKFCQSPKTVKYGIRRHIQYYLCKKCGRTFSGIDSPEGMRTPTPEIATALSLFYGGLPLTKIQMQLGQNYLDWVETSTIYRWITKYSKKAEKIVESYKAKTGNTWVVDETVIDIDSIGKTWFFDAICESTRFLLASHISRGRTIKDVEIILSKAAKVASKTPKFIITDGMTAYPEGIEKVFGADAKHIKMKGITHEININLIERFHSTLKQRTKIMRGLKTFDTARIVLNGFILDYNFFRPHMALEGKTPAQEAKIYLPFANWEGIIRYQS